MSKEDDSAIFLAGLEGVKKLDSDQKPAFEAPLKSLSLDPEKEVQRRVAEGEAASGRVSLESLPPKAVGPLDILEYKNAGVQQGVYKKLRTGKYEIESRLDLHRLRVAEALSETYQFILNCHQSNLRTVSITHGKGSKSEEPAKLKRHLAAWLEAMPEVIAYHSALPKDGGTGAVYILLKKSEQKKIENRKNYL